MPLNRPFDAARQTKDSGGWSWVSNPQALLINGRGYFPDCAIRPGGSTALPNCSLTQWWVPPGRSAVQPHCVIAQLLHRMLDTVVSFTLSEALAVAAAVGLFLGLFSAAALLVLLRWVEKRLVEARPGGDSRPPRHAEPSVRHVPLEGSLQPARDPAPPTGEQTAEIAVIGLPGLAAEAAAGCLPTHEHACRRLCGWLHAFYSMSVSGVRVQRVWITRNGRMALEASLPAAMAATVLAGSKRLKGTGITLGPVLSPSELREREARRQQQPQPTPVPPQPGRQRRAQRSAPPAAANAAARRRGKQPPPPPLAGVTVQQQQQQPPPPPDGGRREQQQQQPPPPPDGGGEQPPRAHATPAAAPHPQQPAPTVSPPSPPAAQWPPLASAVVPLAAATPAAPPNPKSPAADERPESSTARRRRQRRETAARHQAEAATSTPSSRAPSPVEVAPGHVLTALPRRSARLARG